MLNKRIYKRSIAISERDLSYIKSLRQEKHLKKRCLAGINSAIIREYRINCKQKITKITCVLGSFNAGATLRRQTTTDKELKIDKPTAEKPCRHLRTERVYSADIATKICVDCGREIKDLSIRENQEIRHYLANTLVGNNLLSTNHFSFETNTIHWLQDYR